MSNVIPIEKPQDWYFTFGCGQVHAGHYHVIHGTFDEARMEMHARFEDKWSMQYPTAEAAGVEEWGLKILK